MAKAEQFAAAAVSELDASRWDAAGLTAIHAGIAAADAAFIASVGQRSSSQDHGAVVASLASVPEFAAMQRRQLAGLLKMKNAVAYEQRPLAETEARQLVDHARRLTRWAAEVVASRAD
jgi:hypothetical protein